MKRCLKHQIRHKRFIFCSYYDHCLTLTYFIAMSNFGIMAHVTLKDSLDITAPWDLEVTIRRCVMHKNQTSALDIFGVISL